MFCHDNHIFFIPYSEHSLSAGFWRCLWSSWSSEEGFSLLCKLCTLMCLMVGISVIIVPAGTGRSLRDFPLNNRRSRSQIAPVMIPDFPDTCECLRASSGAYRALTTRGLSLWRMHGKGNHSFTQQWETAHSWHFMNFNTNGITESKVSQIPLCIK